MQKFKGRRKKYDAQNKYKHYNSAINTVKKRKGVNKDLNKDLTLKKFKSNHSYKP